MAPPIERSSATACCPHTAGPCRTSKQCRTASLGGQVYFCNQCQQQRYSYHSCKNRHCPKCQNEQANDWLQAQQDLLLPTHHFLVTFTLPAELRAAGSQPSEDDLQPALSRFLAGFAATGPGPALRRRPHRHGRRAPHLDPPTRSIILTSITSSPAAA